MGRDHSVVCHNPNCISDVDIRAIVPSDSVIDEEAATIHFSLKPYKVHIFNAESQVAL